MSERKYSEVDMIGALKQMEAGRTAAEAKLHCGGAQGKARRQTIGRPSSEEMQIVKDKECLDEDRQSNVCEDG